MGSIAQNHFVDAFNDEQADDVSREHFMHQLIRKNQESFPNVEIALRMYLVLMISNSNRGAFILKDETDQEQTSDIGMQ